MRGLGWCILKVEGWRVGLGGLATMVMKYRSNSKDGGSFSQVTIAVVRPYN